MSKHPDPEELKLIYARVDAVFEGVCENCKMHALMDIFAAHAATRGLSEEQFYDNLGTSVRELAKRMIDIRRSQELH